MKIPAFLSLAVCAFSQTGRPSFEVASVKPAELDPAKLLSGQQRIGATIDAARVDLRSLSLADLIRTAYRVSAYQLSGPEWMNTLRFDVVAKLPEGAKRSEIPEMLETLLEQRFQLKFHHSTKEVPGYELVVAKGGARLKESVLDPSTPESGVIQSNSALNKKGGVTNTGPNGVIKQTTGPKGMHLDIQGMTLPALGEYLARLTLSPVANQTDLKGRYDFELDLSREELVALARADGGAIGAPLQTPEPDPDAVTLAVSLDRIGLKLTPHKQPVDLLVIDHLEKSPTEN